MTVFARGLHVPLGFEFGRGGVFVAQPPYLLFLKDTDGDDRADTREIVLDGFGSEDTHVGPCALEWSPGGELIILEGVAKSTTIETLDGPWRNHTPTVYGFDPRTQRLRVLIRPAVVNPWACVINLNGIPQFRVRDDGSGYVGERIEDLVVSSDRNFRPADPQFGPDGALYFADWYTPLIGHMQYSQRDPNRDHTHGRIYRVTAIGRPLLKPVLAAGAPLPELLDQLKSPEDRTRYRARRELRDRDGREVRNALDGWLSSLNPKDASYEHHLCEALWVQQGFHAVDVALLGQLFAARDFHARAAAVQVLADERNFLFQTNAAPALALCRQIATDEHPRVRLEVVRALSFLPTRESVEIALETLKLPLDYSLRYTLESTLGALEPFWKPVLAHRELASNNPAGLEFLLDYESSRMYIACHKVGTLGAELGPTLIDVGKRLPRAEIIESVIDPNAKVDPKYYSVNITTRDGDEFSGLVAGEDARTVTLRIGAEATQRIEKRNITAREILKTSAMPDGLAATLSAQEFVDLVEFLSAQK